MDVFCYDLGLARSISFSNGRTARMIARKNVGVSAQRKSSVA
jgi:hypothetical protein